MGLKRGSYLAQAPLKVPIRLNALFTLGKEFVKKNTTFGKQKQYISYLIRFTDDL